MVDRAWINPDSAVFYRHCDAAGVGFRRVDANFSIMVRHRVHRIYGVYQKIEDNLLQAAVLH